MDLKKSILLIAFLISFSSVFSAPVISCGFQPAATCPAGKSLFYVPSAYNIGGNTFLSAPVALASDANYDTTLCCALSIPEVPGDELIFYYEFPEPSTGACPSGEQPLLYFSYDTPTKTNAVIGLKEDFDPLVHDEVLCVKKPTTISAVDLAISDNSATYPGLGYSCVSKMSSTINGRISSCGATYGAGQQYPYTFWIRGFESVSSLKCTPDCTSKLDDRVYSACSTKVSSCTNVPIACDGSLSGAWVSYNESHQVKCSSPWNEYKIDPSYVPSGSSFSSINVVSDDERCSDIISEEYSVLYNNIPVKMSIYMCGD